MWRRHIFSWRPAGLAIFGLTFTLAGCTGFPKSKDSDQAKTVVPETLAARFSSYGYVPLDPMPIRIGAKCAGAGPALRAGCTLPYDFPDQTVRIAVGKYDSSGSIVYGPIGKASAQEAEYRVIFDYIIADEVALYLIVTPIFKGDCRGLDATSRVTDAAFRKALAETAASQSSACAAYVRVRKLQRAQLSTFQGKDPQVENFAKTYGASTGQETQITVPTYVGVGFRITANVHTESADVNLGSLTSIGAAASQGKASGTMTIQTLGVNGSDITPLVPLPNKIDETTVENALLAVGQMKAQISRGDTSSTATDRNRVRLTPRIVGLYNPVPGGEDVINQIVSTLMDSTGNPITWPDGEY